MVRKAGWTRRLEGVWRRSYYCLALQQNHIQTQQLGPISGAQQRRVLVLPCEGFAMPRPKAATPKVLNLNMPVPRIAPPRTRTCGSTTLTTSLLYPLQLAHVQMAWPSSVSANAGDQLVNKSLVPFRELRSSGAALLRNSRPYRPLLCVRIQTDLLIWTIWQHGWMKIVKRLLICGREHLQVGSWQMRFLVCSALL